MKKCIFFLFFLPHLLVAQESLLKVAEKYYQSLAYTKAIEAYEKALAKNVPADQATPAKINLADAYFKVKDYANAERYLREIIGSQSSNGPLILRYAQVLAANGKYKEAQQYYQNYAQTATGPAAAPAQGFVKLYNNVDVISKNAPCYQVKYLAINTTASDFSPAYYKEGLVFVSNRQVGTAVRRVFAWNGSPFLDLYHLDNLTAVGDGQTASLGSGSTSVKSTSSSVAFAGRDQYTAESPNDSKTIGVFGGGNVGKGPSYGDKGSVPVDQLGGLNSKYHEGPAAFFKDGSKVIFTRNNFLNGKYRKSSDGINKLKLYLGESSKSGSFGKITELPFNSDEYSTGHPTLSADETFLIFASDMPGGFGGTDLYLSTYDGLNWSAPLNLGPEVNTEGNEMFPFLDEVGNLYFSSNGHPGLGDLDVFVVKMKGQQVGGTVTNLGAPINSAKDDFGFITDGERKKGYFSSNRKRGGDDDDIYSFDRTCEIVDGCTFLLAVFDANTKNPLPNAQISYTDAKGNRVSAVTGPDGTLTLDNLAKDVVITFNATLAGYQNAKAEINTAGCDIEVTRIEIPMSPDKPADIAGNGPAGKLNTKTCPISGQILAQTGGKGIANVTVSVKNLCDGSVSTVVTDANGFYRFDAVEGCAYELEAKVANMAARNISIAKVSCANPPQETNIPMFSPGDILTIDNLYFDYGKYVLKKAGIAELDKLLKIMRDYPDMEVELSAHTDSRSSTEFNQTLSDNRALVSAEYLFKRGISRNRVTFQGYGESKPVNGCTDGVSCSEADHAKNRRTEIYIKGINK